MNISEQQLNNMMAAVSVALQPLVRVVPMTAVEWADQNYYLPKESSYGDGEWKTLPFQIAIMNSMGNDQIRTVNLIKSARVGYTKMLLGVVGYFIEHKSRNSLLFQPTDSAAEDFMKSHVVASSRYPKHWLTVGDPAREFTMTQSAPLMVLPDPDEFVVVQVK
ncbi:terminase large subunit of prophage CP-933O [Escherichia coli]|nr:terminase large subunit of prophage CP-933O [Escherichia coli]